MKTFSEALYNEMIGNFYNCHTDNYDYHRFGKVTEEKPKKTGLKEFIKSKLRNKKYHSIYEIEQDIVYPIFGYSHYFEYLYEILNNTESKKLLAQIVAYRIMGHTKVKLPHSNKKYWDDLQKVEKLEDKNDSINPNFLDFMLYKMGLESLGYPITIYFSAIGILIDYVIRQYEYKSEDKKIGVRENDYVLDVGGCWGDTALFFAHETGSLGRIYSFEFVPSNIELFNKNISLNPELSQRIHLIKSPVWDESEKELYFKDFGPGSSVSFEKRENFDLKTKTVKIDDVVKNQNIEKVDFIKMDIEGAELNALKGAKETITKFKPKLAIALYHSLEDFDTIPRFIDSLNLGYKFYINHNTIHAEETILFAECL